jgi:hypothetical protein
MAQLVDEQALRAVIDKLEGLSEEQKQRIKDRWLNYVLWWDSRARISKLWHYLLRGIVVVGGVAMPALIGSAATPTLLGLASDKINVIQWWAFGVSVVVGVAATLEELFRFGEIWRDKRGAAEALKGEGWRYFQLVGKYKDKSHEDAYADFASAVEDMIEHEIKDYLLVTRSNEEQKNEQH